MKGVVNDSITRKANDDSSNSIGVTVNPDGHVHVCYNCKIHEFTLNELIFTEFIYFDRPTKKRNKKKTETGGMKGVVNDSTSSAGACTCWGKTNTF